MNPMTSSTWVQMTNLNTANVRRGWGVATLSQTELSELRCQIRSYSVRLRASHPRRRVQTRDGRFERSDVRSRFVPDSGRIEFFNLASFGFDAAFARPAGYGW